MSDIENTNHRIAKNTIMLYARMFVMLVVSLYTSRVVLRTLGVTDYGIYNVVGGVVSLLGFVSNSMSISVQRFFSYDIGIKDNASLNRTFNTSILVHILIAGLILLCGESIGLYFVKQYINVSPDRLNAAVWVFHFSLLACCFKILQVPFNALIISYERMEIFAYLSIIEAFLNLGIVYLLTIGTFDRLILYSLLMMVVSLLVSLLYGIYCKFKIKEIKYKFCFDKNCFKRLIDFASWSALGEMAWAGTLQGVNIVLNLFFGPVVNASRGISYQVLNAVNRFVQSFQMAVNPQIIKQYAAGNILSMQNLVYRSTRFSFYLLLLLILPLILRTQDIMKLWLGEVPDYLVIFCRLTLINAGLDLLSNLFATIVKAHGEIKKYQIIVSALLFLNLPLSYVILKSGFPPESTYWIYAFLSMVLLFTRLIYLKIVLGLNISSFLKDVICPISLVVLISVPLPLILNRYINNSILGLILMIFITTFMVFLATYSVGITSSERNYLVNKLRSKIISVRRKINNS